jgi:hypothetical protein
MADVPPWWLRGDWFDVCNCTIPCPCYFAQAPTFGNCEGTLAWHIREGRYGEVVLDGLNVLGLGAFTGNIWSGQVKTALGVFFDQRAGQAQREALQMIFTGQAGGWPAQFAELVGDMRGVEFAPIEFKVADDLGWWTARIPGKVHARGEALAGPTTLPGRRVQVHNPPGAEIGPGGIATQGVAVTDQAAGFGFRWERSGRSSKHFTFDWAGPQTP